ncbi:ABC transporter substrate binding protein [Roseateles sp.]|uniref:ABC transporter substrate binding protein n=1 Tax=Roseateles sp. TaxID=1971397 RepID=UPI0039E99F60
MLALSIGRLGQVLMVSLMAVAVATLPGSGARRDPAPARIVFLARGDASRDSYFQRFADAFRSRHARLLKQVQLVALSVPDDPEQMEGALKAEARTHPALFVVQNGIQAQVARRAAPAVPMIFSSQASPLRLGVASGMLRRPEPTTGLWVNDELDGKRLELLLDAYPTLRNVAVLGNAEWVDGLKEHLAEMQAVAAEHGARLILLQAESVDAALSLVDAPGARDIQAWCLPRTTLSLDGRVGRRIAAQGKPLMAAYTPDVYEIAHLSYAHDRGFIGPAMADLAARIVLGEPAGSIPIQVPQRFQLAVRIVPDSRMPAMNPDVVRRADVVIR